MPEVVATVAEAVAAPSTESAVPRAVVVAIPLIRPSPEELMVVLAPPLAALMASLKLTVEVPVLAPFTDSASAFEIALEVACTVASAAELRFKL